MSNVDRIGLPTFMGWLVSGPLVATIFAWILTPVGVYAIAFVFESRLVGRDFHPWKGAFRGFMPGDLFLGASFGQFVWQLGKFESGDGWWTKWWWHVIVACGAVALGYTIRNKNDRKNYDPPAMNSPTKLYHDFVIYMGFGYVFFTTAIAATFATGRDGTLVLPYALLGGWVACLIHDGLQPKDQLRLMAKNSHPSHSVPIWF